MDTEGQRAPAAGPAVVGVAVLAAVAVVIRAGRPILDGPDAFWHLDLGRRIVSSGLPSTDPYSFLTTDESWILNQWGAEALFGATEWIGGLWLLAVLTALLVGAGILLAGLEMWRRSPSLLTVGLLGLVLLAGMRNWALRGNLLTYVLIPLLLHELRRERPRPVVVASILLIWANVHAAFLLGLVLVVIDGVGRVLAAESGHRRVLAGRHAVLVGLGLAATVVTPYGPRLLASTIALAGRGPTTGITEWAPTSLTTPANLPFTILVSVALVALGLTAGRRELPDLLMVVAATILGASAVRNVAPAAIVIGIVSAPYVRSAVAEVRSKELHPTTGIRPLDVGVVATVLVIAMVTGAFLVPRTGAIGEHSANTPIGLIRDLDATVDQARVFTSTFWTPAVSTLAGPAVRTAVDGRLELFSDEELLEARMAIDGLPGWEETLTNWCITDIVIPEDSPLEQLIAGHADWALAGSGPIRASDEEAVWYAISGNRQGC